MRRLQLADCVPEIPKRQQHGAKGGVSGTYSGSKGHGLLETEPRGGEIVALRGGISFAKGIAGGSYRSTLLCLVRRCGLWRLSHFCPAAEGMRAGHQTQIKSADTETFIPGLLYRRSMLHLST